MKRYATGLVILLVLIGSATPTAASEVDHVVRPLIDLASNISLTIAALLGGALTIYLLRKLIGAYKNWYNGE